MRRIAHEHTNQYERISYVVDNRSQAVKLCQKHGMQLGKGSQVIPRDCNYNSLTGYYGKYESGKGRGGINMLFIWKWK